MIQIRNKELDNIALEWWGKLNEKLKNKEKIPNTTPAKYRLYRSDSLIEKIKKKSNETTPIGDFCKYILDEGNEYNILKNIIIGKPKDLKKIIIDLEKEKARLGISLIKYDKKHSDDAFEYLFDYGSCTAKYGYWLSQKLAVNVCPYCNRQYTFTIGTSDKKGTRPEFDHFFDKATYPYLALSFYNLVPSCHICNSNLKHSKKFEIHKNIHPFVEGFENELKFTIKYKVNRGENERNFLSDFDIKFVKNNHFNTDEEKSNKHKILCKAYRNIVTFRLKELYNQHKDVVIELIEKKQTNAKEHMKHILDQFPNLFTDLQDVQKMVIGNYINEEDLGKRPLAKLTRDISEELGLL